MDINDLKVTKELEAEALIEVDRFVKEQQDFAGEVVRASDLMEAGEGYKEAIILGASVRMRDAQLVCLVAEMEKLQRDVVSLKSLVDYKGKTITQMVNAYQAVHMRLEILKKESKICHVCAGSRVKDPVRQGN